MLEEILKLPNISVKEHYKLDEETCIFVVEPKAKKAICTRCGQTSHNLHQNRWHLVKDLSVSGQKTYLKVNRRQWKCKICGRPFSEELEWLKMRRRYTKRLAENILKQLANSNIKTVCKINGVTTAEVERMLKDIEEEVNNQPIESVKKLGIDEIALRKGKHDYCAVLVDLEESKLLRILRKRTKEVVGEELIKWGEEVLENIEEVSIDLWTGYKSIVEELMPNAEVVADRFHVMKKINEELDEQRKKERREINKIKKKSEKELKIKAITNSKYVLLKNREDLTETEKTKLKEIDDNFPKLKRMYGEKERIRKIYEMAKNWEEGLEEIGKWLNKAKDLFPKSSKTIRNWIGEIVSYFDNRTTQGRVEGINNKIKLVKRLAYGFRNFNNFCVRVFLDRYFKTDLAY